MIDEEIRQLRSRLALEIGVDIVEITAADTDRHFDTINFIQQYAGALALVFLTAAATKVWEHVKEIAKDAGKRVGDAAWKKAADAISSLTGLDVAARDEEQLREIKRGVDAMRVLGAELAAQALEQFVAAGRAAVTRLLTERGMPARKVERIATAVAKEIQHLAAGKRAS